MGARDRRFESDHPDHPVDDGRCTGSRARRSSGASRLWRQAASPHPTRILSLSSDLPVLIEVVDQEDRLRAVLPERDAMVGDGLITPERVEVIADRANASESE
ncbi:MAG TPA: DUF190 domain-containing protein [Candidatus Limnocylindrales bacterium]|nr:DUF190 domain-containing protein [Candidatus Limnocylindrales bacterium]